MAVTEALCLMQTWWARTEGSQVIRGVLYHVRSGHCGLSLGEFHHRKMTI